MNIYAWWIACRPNTLIVSIAPVMLGTALAIHNDNISSYFVAFLTLISSIFIQIGTNLINDLFDFINGADTDERLGPLRATQSGLISAEQVKIGAYISFLIALIIGIYLVYIGGYPILIIGILSLISGYCYTAGPYPLAYNGLGDIFVFIFFGIIAVPGTYYLQSGFLFDFDALLIGSSIGFIAVAILCVNNIRDINADKKVGKKTLAVRFGINKIKFIFDLMIILPFISVFLLSLSNSFHNQLELFLVFLSLPVVFQLIADIHKMKGKSLNKVLSRTALLIRLFSALLFLGIIL